jgi:hypothetical protein
VTRELDSVEIPGEHVARERSWRVVEAAFAKRQPVEQRRRTLRPAIAVGVAVVVAVLAAVLSPVGRAVLDEIRDALGVERAQPALFSVPAPGRLLVASDSGVWVVQQNGSKRLLGPYREASWSPYGRFVVAASDYELAALEPDGTVRWTLARPGIRSPRWAGSETDTRIAYVDRTGIRVVAGDGTGDRLLVAGARGPIAWRSGLTLAVVDRDRRIAVIDVETGERISRSGERFEAAAARQPGSDTLARIIRRAATSRVVVGRRIVFQATGQLVQPTWSPDGRWLLVGWPSADQWVFVRADGTGIRAVSNVSDQFRSRSFPQVQGWCCA